MATRILTVGALADKMYDARERKRALDAQLKVVDEEIKELEEAIFVAMDAQGTTKAEGKKAGLSISPRLIANVVDWDALWPWVSKTKSFYMIQKRVNDTSYREHRELGKKVPGVQDFTKRALSVRSL